MMHERKSIVGTFLNSMIRIGTTHTRSVLPEENFNLHFFLKLGRGLLVYRDGGWSLLDWRVYDSTQHPILTTREEQDNTSTSGLPPVASATSTAKPTGVDILPLPVQPASSTPHQRPGTARTRQSVGPQETAPAQEPARRDDSSRTPQDTSHSRVNAKAGR